MDEIPDKVPPTNGEPPSDQQGASVSTKIARLYEELGWNQEEFARRANLNRQTIRTILKEDDRSLRNNTISSCAKALGLTVSDLRTLPLEVLLARVRGASAEKPKHPLDAATQPELVAWRDRNPERARQLSAEEADELLSLQQEAGGPLASFGVEHFVEIIERKRRLIAIVHAIAGTEYLQLLEQLVGLIYEKVQPYRDRV